MRRRIVALQHPSNNQWWVASQENQGLLGYCLVPTEELLQGTMTIRCTCTLLQSRNEMQRVSARIVSTAPDLSLNTALLSHPFSFSGPMLPSRCHMCRYLCNEDVSSVQQHKQRQNVPKNTNHQSHRDTIILCRNNDCVGSSERGHYYWSHAVFQGLPTTPPSLWSSRQR